MIVFDLKCAPGEHVFEAWFGSTDEYEDQRRRGLVSCPICGTGNVDKAVMAPRVGAKGNRSDGPGAALMSPDPERSKEVLAAMAALQKRMVEQSSYVGDQFAEEARSMHLGETEKRSIHGRATIQEAEMLSEEGIPVLPLPFPVVEPGQKN